MPALSIIAHITAQPEAVDLVKSELEKLIAPTRDEEGCLQYDLHRDNTDPAHFMFYESWQSRTLWQVHMHSLHLQDFVAATGDAIKSFTVYEMTPLS